MAEAEPLHHAGPEILQHDVGREAQGARRREICGVLQVEDDRALVAIDRSEVLGVARRLRGGRRAGERRPLAHPVALGRLDLDHVGAQVGEQHPAERAGGDLAELDDADAEKGKHAPMVKPETGNG